MKYRIVMQRKLTGQISHAINEMNEVMCGYKRLDDDEVTTVWFNPALATQVTTCSLCCHKILEATDESIRIS